MLFRGWFIPSFALLVLLAGCGDAASSEAGTRFNCTQRCGEFTGATNPYTAGSQNEAVSHCVADIPECNQTRSCTCVQQ
jgi:hypothetical protein